MRATIGRQLEALGWDVMAVGTGAEAIRIAEHGLGVDVLLTDLHLPDTHGVTIARAVTERSPRTRVAFMSGSAPELLLEPREAPFLLKPFSSSALADALTMTG